MKILATFIQFKSDPDIIELVHAWDEWSVDANPQGYDDTKVAALREYEGDIGARATVTIDVPLAPIRAALDPAVTVQGVVTAAS